MTIIKNPVSYLWKKNNPEKVKAQRRRHYLKYKAKILAKSKEWLKDYEKKHNQTYHYEHRMKNIQRWKEYYCKNFEKVAEYQHQYYLDNIEERKAYFREYNRLKRLGLPTRRSKYVYTDEGNNNAR
jgi:hypothetical protein